MKKALISACAAISAFGLAPSFALAQPLRVGDKAPALAGQTLDGSPFDLASLRGHVVVINLWATWCPPCRAEMPALNAFYLKHRSAGLVVVGVSEDRLRDLADVARTMGAFAYPAVMARRATANGFAVPVALPETIVIDAAGVVRAVLTPTGDAGASEAGFEAAVAPLLGQAAGQSLSNN